MPAVRHENAPRVLSLVLPMTQLQHALPVDRLPDRVPALARHRRAPGGPGAGAAAVLARGPGAASRCRCSEGAGAPLGAGAALRAPRYADTIEPAIAFLQNRDPTLAHRINTRQLLPEGLRFAALESCAADEP
jgi:hypothetical protein